MSLKPSETATHHLVLDGDKVPVAFVKIKGKWMQRQGTKNQVMMGTAWKWGSRDRAQLKYKLIKDSTSGKVISRKIVVVREQKPETPEQRAGRLARQKAAIIAAQKARKVQLGLKPTKASLAIKKKTELRDARNASEMYAIYIKYGHTDRGARAGANRLAKLTGKAGLTPLPRKTGKKKVTVLQ